MWCSKVILKLSQHEWRSSETSLCSVVPPVRHIQMSLLVMLSTPAETDRCVTSSVALLVLKWRRCSHLFSGLDTIWDGGYNKPAAESSSSGNVGKDPWFHRTSQWTISFKQLFTSYVVFVKRGGNTICSCYFHFHLRVMVRSNSSCLFAVKFACLQRLKSGCIVGIVGSSVYVILIDTLD